MLSSQTAQANPQGYIMLQAHVQEHVGMMARDQVTTFFQKSNASSTNAGQQVPQMDPACC